MDILTDEQFQALIKQIALPIGQNVSALSDTVNTLKKSFEDHQRKEEERQIKEIEKEEHFLLRFEQIVEKRLQAVETIADLANHNAQSMLAQCREDAPDRIKNEYMLDFEEFKKEIRRIVKGRPFVKALQNMIIVIIICATAFGSILTYANIQKEIDRISKIVEINGGKQ
jgi:hypothetical protein